MVLLFTTQTTYANLQMTQPWWGKSPRTMRQPTEIQALTSWYQDNAWLLNAKNELVIDFRKPKDTTHASLIISGEVVEQVRSFRYLGVNLSEDLMWGAGEGPGETHLPADPQKVGAFTKAPHQLLPVHHTECPVLLMHGVVLQLHLEVRKDLQRLTKSSEKIISNPSPPAPLAG